MEDDLIIIIMEYLSNHWSDLSQILNLSLSDQTKLSKGFKGRWPPMEDDLKILKVENLSNHWLDLPQIWNLSLSDQTKLSNEVDL